MAKHTQGTDLYTIDPDTGLLLDVGCITSIDGVDTTIEQIDVTCLQDTARNYIAGLATPGNLTFGLNTDTSTAAHVRLFQIHAEGKTLKWAIGWSDSPGVPPTVTTNSNGDKDFNFPATRSWLAFEGFMSSFPFSFTGNAVVTSTVGVQVSGAMALIPATGS